MVNAVRQVVSGQLQGFGRGLIKNVAGNIKDMIGGARDNSPGAAMQNKSRFYTKNLQYPLNVEGDPMQGPYIRFGINQFNGETKAETARSKSMKKIEDGIAKELNVNLSRDHQAQGGKFAGGPPNRNVAIDAGGKPMSEKIKSTGSSTPEVNNARGGNLYASSTAMRRLDTSIALYMPASVSTTYSMNYADTEIGVFSEAITQVANLLTQGFKEGFGSVTQMQGSRLVDTGATAVKRGAVKKLDAVAPGIRARVQIEQGKIISNRMELSFQGINRREFSFTFVFMPKSEQEAKVVQQIIHLFKFHAHGDFGVNAMEVMDDFSYTGNEKADQGMGYEMTIPDTFDIQYMYQGNQNTFLNKISTCFCSNVSVQYGGDRYVAYNPTESLHGDVSPPPQRTTLTLTFKEMEILDRTRIDQGF